MKRILLPAIVGLLVISGMFSAVSAQDQAIRVTIDCSGANESVTVVNNTGSSIVVRSITSLSRPRPGEEPFGRNDEIPPGGSITYSFGAGAGTAGGIRVTSSSIFSDELSEEGVRVETSAGPVEALCSAGIGSLVVGPAGASPVVPTLVPTSTPPATDVPEAEEVVGTGGGEVPAVPVAATPTPPVVETIPDGWAWVVRVIDGDTMDVQLESSGAMERVRVIGIDAPEIPETGQARECYGPEAAATARSWLADQWVWLEADPTQDERDASDRLLRYVWSPNGDSWWDFGEEMLRAGSAYEFPFPAPHRYQAFYQAAEAFARENSLGLWSPDTCAGER